MLRQHAEEFRSRCVHLFRAIGLAFFGIHLLAGSSHGGVLTASWIAPTTNTDGSALTQLAFYRLYYGTSDAPCPGTTYFEVASSTSVPPPNQTVSAQLTGLTTASIYSVSVTAVDTSGRESACSQVASAIARGDSAVTPTAPVDSSTTPPPPDNSATTPTVQNGSATPPTEQNVS